METTQKTDRALRQNIEAYEDGIRRRFLACVGLVAAGLAIALALGDGATPIGWAVIATGFVVACCGAVPGARNMILRGEAQAAAAELRRRGHAPQEQGE